METSGVRTLLTGRGLVESPRWQSVTGENVTVRLGPVGEVMVWNQPRRRSAG